MTENRELEKERLALFESILKMQDRVDKINRTLNKNAYVATKHRGRISKSNMDKDQQSKCPKCKTPLYCPCKACVEREPKGLTYQDHYHWKHGEVICCPVCGYEDGCDMWV
jgi:Pyruvate/2-oxoacid:ferredoxin oxidoreductase delta subunit